MATLNLDLRTFDVGVPADTPEAFADLVVGLVLKSWDEGADLVVLPEFTWMGLERFTTGTDKPVAVAVLFWDQLWPGVREKLSRSDKAVVLGSVPFLDDLAKLRNRVPILSNGEVFHQDKIHLTPWEDAFVGGGPLRLWRFKGLTLAVVICLDIEIPEISAALRARGVDLLLVPSATESILGVERVGRCADARAVELGCHVAVCHLVGRAESDLIDVNIGRLSFFSPSQTPFLDLGRQDPGPVIEEGFHRRSFRIDTALLERQRTRRAETDPAKVRASIIDVIGEIY